MHKRCVNWQANISGLETCFRELNMIKQYGSISL